MMSNNKGKIEEEGIWLMEYIGRPANKSKLSLPFWTFLMWIPKNEVKTERFLVEFQLHERERWRTVEAMEQDKVVQWSNFIVSKWHFHWGMVDEIVRFYVGWRGEWNISYKGVETSP